MPRYRVFQLDAEGHHARVAICEGDRIMYTSKPLYAVGVGCAYTLAYWAAHRVCGQLDNSLAVLVLQAAGDRRRLRRFISNLMKEELANEIGTCLTTTVVSQTQRRAKQ